MAREFDIQELKWLISSIEGAIESGDRREAEGRLSELEWEISHLENYVKTKEQAPVIEVAKGAVPASPAAVAKAVVDELRKQNLLSPVGGATAEDLLALSAKVHKMRKQLVGDQTRTKRPTQLIGEAYERSHPDLAVEKPHLEAFERLLGKSPDSLRRIDIMLAGYSPPMAGTGYPQACEPYIYAFDVIAHEFFEHTPIDHVLLSRVIPQLALDAVVDRGWHDGVKYAIKPLSRMVPNDPLPETKWTAFRKLLGSG